MSEAALSVAPPRAEKLRIFGTIGRTFQTFGVAPLFFMTLALCAAVPGLIRVAIIGAAAAQKLSWSMLASVTGNLLIAAFMYGAISYIAVRSREGEPVTFAASLKVGANRFLPMFAVTILTIVAFELGLVLLVVPGLIAACAFAVGVPVCAMEPRGPIECLRRSSALTKGSRWRILAIYILFFVPITGIGIANLFLVQKTGHPVAFVAVNIVVSLFTAPLAIILGAELYDSLRRLKENVGVASVFD